ncbi:MAG: RNA polymerase sigma factor WhiG [Firmicutes bacterium]|nr:RNA polymerase sigma factor WhiG [Bacillota bacterium]
MPKESTSLDKLWEEFKQNRDSEAREKLILEYASLIKYVAGRLAIGMPSNVEFDDLVSFGVFGLMDALDKFEPDRGIKFETYALARIRGAIIDGLRSLDWVPRSVRTKARKLEQTIYELDTELGRPATDSEIAEAMDCSLDEYYKTLQEIACTTVTSLDEVWSDSSGDGDKLNFKDALEDERSPDPLKLAEFNDLRDRLGQAIDDLPERERLVITLYYYEGLTLKEIGAVLEVTEARVSQIHSKAVARLRTKLRIK